MALDMEVLKAEALEAGFTNAGELNMAALVFMPEVRAMCSADKCHSYGRSWICPPACGTIEEASQKAVKYSKGIIVQVTGNMDDDFDYETIEATSKNFGKAFSNLLDKWLSVYDDMLPMGAGSCRLCKKCTYPDAPCRFPKKAYPSMEAYGLWVSKVCEMSGISYNYGKQTITFTGCFLLNCADAK